MSDLGLVRVDEYASSWPTIPAVGEADPGVAHDDSRVLQLVGELSRDYCQTETHTLCMSTRLQGIEACRSKLMNALHLEEGANEARRYGIFW